MWGFYPSLTKSALAGVDVASGSAEDDPDREKAEHAEDCEGKVGGSEKRPGFHVGGLTEVIIPKKPPEETSGGQF
jgi:hypothetical protein